MLHSSSGAAIHSANTASCLKTLSLQLGVSERTLLSILRLFYDEYHALPDLINATIHQQDWSALNGLIHKMKGSCSSLRMEALRAHLISLESGLKQRKVLSVEDMQPLYRELDLVIDRYELATK